MRAKPDAVYLAAGLLHEAVHFVVHLVELLDAVILAADAGLIGGHGQRVIGLGEEGDGIHAAFNRYPFVYRFHKIVAVVVNHAVAVENNQFHIMPV